VLFPLPFQGHISPMLQLAGALRARGLAVTVLHTAFNAPDPARHPGLAFVAVPDAIPEAAAAANGIAKILALNAAMEASGRVRAALASLMAAEGQPRLACLVLDSTLPAAQKAAAALGLPTLVLHTGDKGAATTEGERPVRPKQAPGQEDRAEDPEPGHGDHDELLQRDP
jgi:hypothetical protein